MAHNTRIRPNLAAWSPGPVSAAEFDALDQGQFESINGDDGGVWAPASTIVIGGSGVQMTGTFETNGAFNLTRSGDTNFAMLHDVAPAATRKATFKGRMGTEYIRTYQCASPVCFEQVLNAQWSGAVFNRDSASNATRLRHHVVGLDLERLLTDGTDTWGNKLGLRALDGATPANVEANALYAQNVVKAWGRIDTNGAGGAALSANGSFNISSVAISGTDLVVTLQVGFSAAGVVCALATRVGTSVSVVLPISNSTTTVTFRMSNTTGPTTQDLSIIATTINVLILGHQT